MELRVLNPGVPVGRLAPTPSGRLHLGNALAFGVAWLSVRARSGRLLLRIEDVDRQRARTEIERSIREDLRWLGIDWDEETPPQRLRDYTPWLDRLRASTYRCTCSRREVAGPYPGTCRGAAHAEGGIRFRLPPGEVTWVDRRFGPRTIDPNQFGDPVLMRRDGVATYNLAVVVDDLCDGVTEVVRGADLLDYTAVQLHLWRAFGATPPSWLHAPLVLGPDGAKLSKSHGSTEIRALAAAGATPADVWRRLLPALGLGGFDHLHAAVGAFRPDGGSVEPITAR
ncbi:MAG: glutamate--tRNA ligase family protein [Myxococcota bacterium]